MSPSYIFFFQIQFLFLHFCRISIIKGWDFYTALHWDQVIFCLIWTLDPSLNYFSIWILIWYVIWMLKKILCFIVGRWSQGICFEDNNQQIIIIIHWSIQLLSEQHLQSQALKDEKKKQKTANYCYSLVHHPSNYYQMIKKIGKIFWVC